MFLNSMVRQPLYCPMGFINLASQQTAIQPGQHTSQNFLGRFFFLRIVLDCRFHVIWNRIIDISFEEVVTTYTAPTVGWAVLYIRTGRTRIG